MALFQQAKAAAKKVQNNYIAEIRCGRMNMNSETHMVEPEVEKGLLYVHRSRDDMLVHLCWKNRNSDAVLDDMIIFEGDCTVKKIKQLPEHRVFFVKINELGTRKFYWFQHTDGEKDEQLIKDLNFAINDPTAAEAKKKAAAAGAGGNSGILKGSGGGGGRTIDANALNSLLSGNGNTSDMLNQLMQSGAMDQNAMQQLLEQLSGGADLGGGSELGGGSQTPSATTVAAQDTPVSSNSNAKGGASKKLKMNDLANAFSMVKNTAKYDLTKVLGTDSLVGMLSNKEVQDRLNEHMPKDEKISGTEGDIRAAVGSPQYQQAVVAFQEALESGQLGPVLAQFKLPEAAIKAAGSGNIKAFAEAMESDKKKPAEASSSSKKEDNADAKMDEAEKSDEKTKSEKAAANDASTSKENDDEDEKMAVD